MTKAEKELVKAIVKFYKYKGWGKPSEYTIYCDYFIQDIYFDRDDLEEFIDHLWNEVNA